MADDDRGRVRSEQEIEARLQRTERHQWSVLAVVLLLIAGQGWIATKLGLEPWWILPLLVGVLALSSWTAALVPGRNRWLDRTLGLSLVGLLAAGVVASTLLFVMRVFTGTTLSPPELILTGAVLWSQSVGVFGMAYWEIDGGGPVQRAADTSGAPWTDFMFPQQQPAVATDWAPSFGDYLYVSLTNATAFSPTDTMPMSHRAKAVMGAQSVTSAAILIVLVARAVNIAK
jgi:hypothetical protein